MKKTSDNSKGKGAARKKQRACLMAYTLNNTQPVICTIVADQPYFYMDDDQYLAEEDDILGFEEYEDFERDLADLKKKIDAYDRLAKSYERAPERRMEEFSAEAINICEASSGDNAPLQVVDHIHTVLSESRMAKALLDFAADHKIYLMESDQVDTASYEREKGAILIHPQIDRTEGVLLAVRELRRHWQHRKGVLIHPLTFHPDQAILINRAQMADLTIAMIRSAWEMQLAGRRDMWDFIENSAMADLGRAFAREAFVDFRSLSNGKASGAVFESWFLSERCRHQDKKLIQAMLADHQGYVFGNPEMSRSVSIDLISALGEQPFGKNYLAPYAQMITEDPMFTEVRDRSNANFLWFIKFERSFRETEQALQNGEGILETGVLSASTPSDKGSDTHGAESIIIPLHRPDAVIHRSETRAGRLFLEGTSGSANVIHVRFGEGQGV